MPRFWMEGLVAAAFAASAAVCAVAFADAQLPGAADPAIALVELEAASFSHRSSGEFTQDGRIVTAPPARTCGDLGTDGGLPNID
jgi:hypothetical protein